MFSFGDQLSHREKDQEAFMPVKHSLYQNAGEVSVDQRHCNRCGLCVSICPAEVLTLEAGSVQQLSTGFDCIACGHCMMVCPQKCISVNGRGLSPADLRPLPPLEGKYTWFCHDSQCSVCTIGGWDGYFCSSAQFSYR